MRRTTINEVRFIAIRDRKVYQSILADAEREYACAVENVKRSADEILNGKKPDFRQMEAVTEAVEAADKKVRHYRQLADIYKACQMGIEIPSNKFENDDVESGVLKEEAVWWLQEAIKAKKQSKFDYYLKIVTAVLGVLIAAVGLFIAATKRDSSTVTPGSTVTQPQPVNTNPASSPSNSK